MPENNYAESDKRIRDNPTKVDCRRLGSTHFHYGWARSPWGHWTEDQVALYNEGYDAAKEAAK